MTEEEIKALIERQISHYRSTYRLMKDDFSSGALEALVSLIQQIEEESEKEFSQESKTKK
jgi:hypothetical protein